MELENQEGLNRHEQIIRKVSEIGNGAHIFAPKEWVNEEVLVIRLEKKSIKEQILEAVYPYLDKITAILLYGSYARKEEDENSDIDVLIIAKEKFKIQAGNKLDFIVISEDFLESAIKINPIMMYSIFQEAVPIINSQYYENLKKLKVNPHLFMQFLKTTKDEINSDKEILELDKKTGKTASNSLIYSLILRLRGIFIIKCLLNKEKYSNKLFEDWLVGKCKINYSEVYNSYRAVRAKEEIKDTIPIQEAELMLKLLEEELKKLNKLIS